MLCVVAAFLPAPPSCIGCSGVLWAAPRGGEAGAARLGADAHQAQSLVSGQDELLGSVFIGVSGLSRNRPLSVSGAG